MFPPSSPRGPSVLQLRFGLSLTHAQSLAAAGALLLRNNLDYGDGSRLRRRSIYFPSLALRSEIITTESTSTVAQCLTNPGPRNTSRNGPPWQRRDGSNTTTVGHGQLQNLNLPSDRKEKKPSSLLTPIPNWSSARQQTPTGCGHTISVRNSGKFTFPQAARSRDASAKKENPLFTNNPE